MSEPIAVLVGECRCPGAPHSEDIVYLEPELTMPMAAAGMASLSDTLTTADVEAGLTEAFLPRGIRSWTFLELDDKGKVQPVEVNRVNLEHYVPFDQGGYELIEKAGELYMARFMRPLVKRIATLSAHGQTDDSTSPSRPSGGPPPAPSPRSLPANGAGRRSAAPVR